MITIIFTEGETAVETNESVGDSREEEWGERAGLEAEGEVRAEGLLGGGGGR